MVSKIRKIKLKKIIGNLLGKLPKLWHGWNVHLEIFSDVLKQKKILASISFSEQIFYRKQWSDAPEGSIKEISFNSPNYQPGEISSLTFSEEDKDYIVKHCFSS